MECESVEHPPAYCLLPIAYCLLLSLTAGAGTRSKLGASATAEEI
eukprot:COSAG06_NODE_17719_length_925_cov_0.711864_1_plen_44_part_10